MLVEGCKHELEITVPVEEVDRETERVISDLQKKVRLPGFRPGKAPVSLIRTRFAGQVRQEVLESVIPKALTRRFEEDHLNVVGRPNITDLHYDQGEPLRFKAEFEVVPEIELNDEYRGIAATYREPVVTDADVEERLQNIRESRAEYVNIDPRPVEDGDYAVVSLQSLSGLAEPVKQDEMIIHVGDSETLPAFNEALIGMSPGDEKEVEVAYPEDFGQRKLAGRKVRFHMALKVLRRKELPEVNDEFARDVGDYQNLEELKQAVRNGLFREREQAAQNETKEQIMEKLVDLYQFAAPQAYVDRQIESDLEQQLRQLAGAGVDPRKLNLDWDKLKEARKDKAEREVKASLLLDRISQREAINATQDEVDREVQRIARQEREPVAAVRKKLQDSGALGRLALAIRNDKTMSFLFEHARKEAPVEAAQPSAEQSGSEG
ncbi:MAG TPA: trigger factor [Bryobacteraceae bacterium]|nr:trigger factor [Bryobacteraceae bacterium]